MTIPLRQAIANALQGDDKPGIGETCAEFAARMRDNLTHADYVIEAIHKAGYFMCPRKPTDAMLHASMNTVTYQDGDFHITKTGKHLARLRAVLAAAMKENVRQ
jgi:hypothetical protein